MADKISGYAIQWNRPAIIAGAFEERFARGAFDKSLRDNPDVVALWAHDSSKPLGRVANGTLELKSDNVGIWYALEPNPAAPNGMESLATVGRSDVTQVSVGFSPLVEEWDDKGDLPKRLITEAKLHEISLVVWAAYGNDTSASIARSNASNASRRKAEAAMRARGI